MTSLRRLQLSILASAFAASAAFAQTGTLIGSVRNAATRAPIEGALVRVDGTGYAAFTGASGSFAIFGVPPGVYTISARAFGFITRELTGVDVHIARTRNVAFTLRAGYADAAERGAYSAAFVDPSVVATTMSLSRDQLLALPTLSLTGALSINGGYLDLPPAGSNIAIADLHRGLVSIGSMRGGRPEATQYLLDGIDANNPVFGSPPLLIDPFLASGVTVSPAYADPEYNGAVSGLVSQQSREGGSRVNGALEYQSSTLPGKLGAAASAASSAFAARGFLSGPVPLTGGALKFMIGGHAIGERARVIQSRGGPWRGEGDTEHDQFIAKLTYDVRPTVRLQLSGLGQHRGTFGVDPNFITGDTVVPASVSDDMRFLLARIEKRFARASVSLSVGDISARRLTCSYWQGVCVRDRLARYPQGDEVPAFGVPPRQTPYGITGQFFGGETYRTQMARADVIAQVTDHHEIRAGVYAASHDIGYRDAMAHRWSQGAILAIPDVYRTRPVEISSYVQDAIQHDFFTIHIGARFAYGNTGGLAFVDPLNPTNGTTAREVCDGQMRGVSETPFTYGAHSGLAACFNSPVNEATGRQVLLDSAARLAQSDDFRAVRPRVAFAPRISLSLPLTERMGMFLNVGRYARHPVYHNAFRNTGTGSFAGLGDEGDGMCRTDRVKPGTTECVPNVMLARVLPEFIGNPDLPFEKSEGFEAGFSSEWGRLRAIDMSVFSSTQARLPRLFEMPLAPDLAATYGTLSQGTQRTVLGRGYLTSLGISVTVRRRLENHYSYSANYTWQRIQEVGAVPDLVAEGLATGELVLDGIERFSSRGRAHALNAMFAGQWSRETPEELAEVGEVLLRNAQVVLTVYAATGSQAGERPDVCVHNPNLPCAVFQRGINGSGTIANLLYVKSLTTTGPKWALIIRVRNLLDSDDGSALLSQLDARRRTATGGPRIAMPAERVSLRRILMGASVSF